MEKTKIILDCDPGHDDAVAILLAVGNPNIDLLGVTTVGGNQSLDKVTYNARAVLEKAHATRRWRKRRLMREMCASGSVWMCQCMRAADSRWCVKK